MTDSFKDRLKTDLQNAKAAGGTRTARIRDIFQSAVSQSWVELKEGTGEIRSIAGQSFVAIAQDLNAAEPSESSETPSVSTVLRTFKTRFVNQVKSQLVNLDAKLTVRYGDRYQAFKQRLQNFGHWYNNVRANAEAAGTDPLRQKQIEVETKIGEAGISVARKEQQIRQQLKERVSAAVTKF